MTVEEEEEEEGGRSFLSSMMFGHGGNHRNWAFKKHSARCSPNPRGPLRLRGEMFPLGAPGWGRTGGLSLGVRRGRAGACGGRGAGAGLQSQMQAQQRVEQSSLAGGPALPAFLLTLGSRRTKDMARAQW